MPGNDIAQVHRYLDLGARLKICHGPVDVLAADAIRELLSYKPNKPVLLAESGAVEPRHTGPFKLYAKDKTGIILHDVLFAPFFVGAAGTGQIWHWDHYVAKNNLWFQFDRFAETVKGIDPPAEKFQTLMIEHPRLRVYVLKGKQTLLAWCRDKQNDWQIELAQGEPPEVIQNASVDFSACKLPERIKNVQVYDPWSNQWSQSKLIQNRVSLPDFRRSIVIKIQ